ncbi:hypothetical protein BWI17_17360 [Betaproteobacteria bacterium GR16-43]|nr:hypothetical protein BWI17_17360 [Betaproteobacteria bacterium GR16-43]
MRSLCLAVLLLFAHLAFADLRSFFHGDPPPVVKAPPPRQLAVVSTIPGVAADAQVESFLRTYAAALMARDAAPVLKRLSPKYAVDGAPEGSKPADFMAQAIAKMRGPTQIVIRSVETSGAVRVAKAEFHYSPEKIDVKTLRFDASGDLLESDLFRLERA